MAHTVLAAQVFLETGPGTERAPSPPHPGWAWFHRIAASGKSAVADVGSTASRFLGSPYEQPSSPPGAGAGEEAIIADGSAHHGGIYGCTDEPNTWRTGGLAANRRGRCSYWQRRQAAHNGCRDHGVASLAKRHVGSSIPAARQLGQHIAASRWRQTKAHRRDRNTVRNLDPHIAPAPVHYLRQAFLPSGRLFYTSAFAIARPAGVAGVPAPVAGPNHHVRTAIPA